MAQKVTAVVGQVPAKFSRRKLPKIPLIIIALLIGGIGTYAIINSLAATTTSPSVYWGAWVDGDTYSIGADDAPWGAATWNTFEQHAGKKVSIIHYGQPPMWSQAFDPGTANLVTSRGAIPMMDMDSANVSLSSIASGSEDSSITTWAQAVKNWGKPFFFRWNWEMNGTWYNWGQQAQQNPAAFVAAWQHIHKVVTDAGATNVTWVWCPNTVYPGSTSLSQLYPGDSYVDWTCVDGYNKGPLDGDSWQSFSQIFQDTYNQLHTIAPSKPIMIGETASNENGGNKANWITDALQTQLPNNYPNVKAIVWFNWPINENGATQQWPIESSPSAQAAFASAIASPYYASNTFGNLPPLTTVQPLSGQSATPPPDTTPPTVSLTAPAANTTVSGTSTAVSASASDDTAVAGVQFKLDGNNLGAEDTASPYSITWNTTSAANGTHTLSAVARDAAGNTASAASRTVTVSNTAPDTTPPDTTISANPASSTTSTSASFSFVSSESNSTFACKLDGASYNVCTSPKAYTNLGVGSHSFSVQATDASGNQDATPATYNWTITAPPDTTSPTVSFASPVNGATVSGIVTATASASDNVGVAKVELSLDGVLKMTDTASPYSYSFDSKTLANGNHTLTAKAYDAAGNSSTSTITVNVNNPDTTPPNAPTNLKGTAASATTVNLSWTAASDTGSNPTGVVKYNVLRNGIVIAQQTGTSYTDTSAVAKTSYNYTVQAVDGAGNVSSNSNAVAVTTPAVPDTTPPSTPTNLAATAASSSQVNLTWNASTDTGGSGLAGYNIYRDGTKLNSSPVNGMSYGDGTVSPNATYNYTVQAVDGTGNTSAKSAPATVTTPAVPDTTPPSTPTNLAATAASSSQVNLTWNASTDTGGSGLAGYNIYRNGTKLNISLTTNTFYNDTTVSASTNYSYTAQAVDMAGNASAKTAAISVTTPSTGHTTRHDHGHGQHSRSQTASPSTSAVAVTVVSPTNQPVAGATVTVSGQTSKTDGHGIAHFSNIVSGKQSVSIQYNGKTLSKTIRVKSPSTHALAQSFKVSTVQNRLSPALLFVPLVILGAAAAFIFRPWSGKFAVAGSQDEVPPVVSSNHPEPNIEHPGRKLEKPGTIYSPTPPSDEKPPEPKADKPQA